MNRRMFLKWLGGGAIAGVMAFSAIGVQRVAAQPAGRMEARTASAPQSKDELHRKPRFLRRALIRATADLTGLTHQAVVEQVRGGRSLAQVAQDKTKTGDDIVNAVANKAKERLDRAVAAGKLTQVRADNLLARLRTAATRIVNTPGQARDE